MTVRPIDASRFGEILEQWKKDCLEDNDTQGADIISDVILQLDDMPTLTPGKFYPYIERPFVPPVTNADRIRAMSDEELASFMMYPVCKYTGCKGDCTEKNIGVTGCRKKILNWLQQPAKEE